MNPCMENSGNKRIRKRKQRERQMGLFNASYQMTLQFQSPCPPGIFLPLLAVFWASTSSSQRWASEWRAMEGDHAVLAAGQWSLSRGVHMALLLWFESYNFHI